MHVPEEVTNSYKKLDEEANGTKSTAGSVPNKNMSGADRDRLLQTPDEIVRKQAAGNTDLDMLQKLMNFGKATGTMWGQPPDGTGPKKK